MAIPRARALLAAALVVALAACPGGRPLPTADHHVCTTCCDPKLPCYVDFGAVDRSADRLATDRGSVDHPGPDQNQKPCAWDNCSACAADYCDDSKHAKCVSTNKCRCLPGWVGSPPNVYDPGTGCPNQVSGCNPPTACNPCGIGVCGANADCNGGKCACASGFANCDGDWFNNGCECHGTCSGTQCVP